MAGFQLSPVSIPYPGAAELGLVYRDYEIPVPAGTLAAGNQDFESVKLYTVPQDRLLLVKAAGVWVTEFATVTSPFTIRDAYLIEKWLDNSGAEQERIWPMLYGYGTTPGSGYSTGWFWSMPDLIIVPNHYLFLHGMGIVSGVGPNGDAFTVYMTLHGHTVPLGNTNLNG